jgi:hypothetical protein
VDWKLLAAIVRNPQALMLLIVCGVAVGYAFASGSLVAQVLGAVVAVATFSFAVHLARRP